MQEDKCMGLMGKLFGHKFVARCDESRNDIPPGEWFSQKIPEDVLLEAIQTESLEDIIRTANGRKSTYIHDVCVRCGKVIRREQV